MRRTARGAHDVPFAPDVVVIDDHADTAAMMADALAFHGIRVRAFTDPIAALEAMRASPPDLALMDLHMPALHGIELAARLRDHAATRGVVLVAITGQVDVGGALGEAFDACLAKPVDLRTLPDLLRALADTRASGVRGR